jgi:hypothetical protein
MLGEDDLLAAKLGLTHISDFEISSSDGHVGSKLRSN